MNKIILNGLYTVGLPVHDKACVDEHEESCDQEAVDAVDDTAICEHLAELLCL
jgi:hypothetical protein